MGNKDGGLTEMEKKRLHEEDEYYEDEINLIDYFLVLGRHKLLIILGSLLPALAVGLFFYLSPREYKLTYCYDVRGERITVDPNTGKSSRRYESYAGSWDLDNKNFRILLDRFYSDRNIGQIISGLESKNLNQYAEKIKRASSKSDVSIRQLIDFEVYPPFIETSHLDQAGPEELKRLTGIKAELLWLTITSKNRTNLYKIGSVIRDNLENVIPVYIIEEKLKADARRFRRKMADIEEDRFQRDIRLETNREILEKLENADITEPRGTPGNAGIEFDVGNKSEYLPLESQIRAVKSRIIELEGQVSADKSRYHYYRDSLELNNDIINKLQNDVSSGYTVHRFRDFLDGVVDECENENVKNYLTSFIKRIDNRISATVPVTEKPRVSAAPRGTAKKAGVTFAIALLLSIFAAFLREGIKQTEVRK